jgi:hypothetical protein
VFRFGRWTHSFRNSYQTNDSQKRCVLPQKSSECRASSTRSLATGLPPLGGGDSTGEGREDRSNSNDLVLTRQRERRQGTEQTRSFTSLDERRVTRETQRGELSASALSFSPHLQDHSTPNPSSVGSRVDRTEVRATKERSATCRTRGQTTPSMGFGSFRRSHRLGRRGGLPHRRQSVLRVSHPLNGLIPNWIRGFFSFRIHP